MASKDVELHPEAVAEARASFEWYLRRNESAASGFMAELDRAVDLISQHPERWPRFLAGTRRYLLRRFPFSVVYREFENHVQIVAIAHGRRKPGYWRDR